MAQRGRPPQGQRELTVPNPIGLGLLAALCPAAMIDRVLKETGTVEQSSRRLPSRLIVYYLLAM